MGYKNEEHMLGGNTCISCGAIIPEGLLACELCMSCCGNADLSRDALRLKLMDLHMGFSRIKGVVVYKTSQGTYKVASYNTGTDCLTLCELLDYLMQL